MPRETWEPKDGSQGALEMLDGLTETSADVVPTLDSKEPAASYKDWDPAATRIIACRIANDLYLRDERFESRDEARAAIQLRHGRILEANYVPGRAFFRVFRVCSVREA